MSRPADVETDQTHMLEDVIAEEVRLCLQHAITIEGYMLDVNSESLNRKEAYALWNKMKDIEVALKALVKQMEEK